MPKEFIDTSTARIALVTQSSLGCFELLQKVSHPLQYAFVLRLDVYQSNCLRAWLEYRWRFQALIGAQIAQDENRSLVLSLSVQFPEEELAQEAFAAWCKMLNSELELSLSERGR